MWPDWKRIGGRFTPMGDPAEADILDLARHSKPFRDSLEAAKLRCAQPDLPWYPYDSFANLFALDKLLHGENRRLLQLAGSDPLLDIGCADGAVSFYLESLGYDVHALDYALTNHNGMRGIWALHRELKSRVQIRSADLDSQFLLPQQHYGLVFFMGILYHLKNPYYALETLARHSRYCIVSTRIARVAPDRTTPLDPLPVAYLLDPGETNNDWTNYWIFSEAGLRRIVDRTHWDICDFMTTGCTDTPSDPASKDGDERAFCLLRSRLAPAEQSIKLLDGWHGLEDGNWRWTSSRFSVLLESAPTAAETLQLRFVIHEALLAGTPSLDVSAAINGHTLAKQSYNSPGPQTYVVKIPSGVLREAPLQVQFELSNTIGPTSGDHRSLGLQVSFDDPGGPLTLT